VDSMWTPCGLYVDSMWNVAQCKIQLKTLAQNEFYDL
jgi:hypothetical protein